MSRYNYSNFDTNIFNLYLILIAVEEQYIYQNTNWIMIQTLKNETPKVVRSSINKIKLSFFFVDLLNIDFAFS